MSSKKTWEIGRVISNRMQKSVVVAVDRETWNSKYKAMRKWTKKLMAHDEADTCNIGDTVRIDFCRPRSKRKSYEVTEIVRREDIFDPSKIGKAAAQRQSSTSAPAELQQLSPTGSPQLSRGFAASVA